MPQTYQFKRATREDFPLLYGWLSQAAVREFWGDPDRELALIEEEIDGGDCNMHIVWGIADGREAAQPFAFIQDWGPETVDIPHMDDVPTGTRAIDVFLGDAAFLGQGHAKAFVRQYAELLLANGAARVVSDPECRNARSIAMFKGAGFEQGPRRICETGDPVYIMTFKGGDSIAKPQQTPETDKT
ncbi:MULTISPECIES: acetyltransferase [Halocynthiibacter]|uniref:Acetyltransferase n=1 Tax=Halocynthiibacter halioticoli TaxID=2986804 RepID=A0AAE3LS65_9RHOB|nr:MULTISPECIES: acetyltransferase [Halocynthiibacter]MCV6825224.1 acetyltransferase [Halocynthiibacter halioticoli]MCW4058225.1 acetyltransferase [Halocynthiibacter sp. SDUM655004]